ncbi:MAG: arsenate reductase [Linnemannia gamsii]|nr:MAG: arsenate reductase [Linnemannia gamsii]
MADIMFVCMHNAIRSQMAAAFFNKHRTQDRVKAVSAGVTPAAEVPDFVRNIMQEADVDLSGIKPVKLTAELAKTVSTIVTLGCGEACPHFPGVDVVDWKLADSKDRSLDGAREMRSEIEGKVKVFIVDNNY